MGMVLSTMVSLAATAALPTQPMPERPIPSHIAISEPRADRGLDFSAASVERSVSSSKFEDPPPVFKRTDERRQQSSDAPGVWLGPVKAQLGGLPGDRRFHFASFRLNQSALFGANIAASVDKHAAKIVLNWPTDH
jgi:hypothetical protein